MWMQKKKVCLIGVYIVFIILTYKFFNFIEQY